MHRRVVATLLLAVSLCQLACHAQFRRFARRASGVETAAVIRASPTVDLTVEGKGRSRKAKTRAEALRRAAAGVAARRMSARVRRRMVEALDPKSLRGVVEERLGEELRDKLPFGERQDQADGLLRLRVTRYGLVNGPDGLAFLARLRGSLYRASDDRRIYDESVTCRKGGLYAGNPRSSLRRTAAAVAFAKSLAAEQLKRRVEQMLKVCTSKLVDKMQKHAS